MRTDRRASLKWTQRYENATKTVPASCRDPPPHTHTCPKDTLRACMLSSGSETPQLRMHATSRPCFFFLIQGNVVHCSCMVQALDIIPFICLNFGCSSSHHLLQVAMQEYILNYSQSVIYVAQCIRNNSRLFRPIRTSPHHFQKLLLRVILCEHSIMLLSCVYIHCQTHVQHLHCTQASEVVEKSSGVHL